jgi:hypothetical protein
MVNLNGYCCGPILIAAVLALTSNKMYGFALNLWLLWLLSVLQIRLRIRILLFSSVIFKAAPKKNSEDFLLIFLTLHLHHFLNIKN